MISFLQGTVASITKDRVVVLTSGGVGYDVHMTLLSVSAFRVGQAIGLYTHMKVSDSAITLYGFDSPEKRAFFTLLLSVKNIGPKSALTILSLGSIDDIKHAIIRGDAAYLSAVQGMGKKTAERLVVELKSKITTTPEQSAGSGSVGGDKLSDVVDALISMGYSKDEAKQRVQQLSGEEKNIEQLLKEALRS